MKNRNTGFCLVITKWILFFFLIKGIASIQLVKLNVPARVRKGSEVQLSCLYDLGNQSLYSLKWFYRNHNPMNKNLEEQEFFRYTPRTKPFKQVFPLDGINVDMQKSDGGTVYIRETNGRTSGNYKCEISVEGTFQTLAKEALMMVEANRASNLSSTKLMDRITKLMFELLCTSCSIVLWIVSTHLSQEFFSSSANRRVTNSGLNNKTKTTSSQQIKRNKPLIQSLIDYKNTNDDEIKCESLGIGT